MRLVGAVVIAALLAPAPARAKCAMPILEAQVLTHAGDPIPTDGGVLVGWTTSTDWEKPRRADDPALGGWKLAWRKRAVPTRVTSLAPGLAVYAPKKQTRGKLALGSFGTFRFGEAGSSHGLAAPVVKEVRTTDTPRGRWRSVVTDVTLDAAPPAAAHALIVYVGDAAVTWAPLAGATTTVRAFDDDGRCEVHPPGMRAVRAGEDVSVAFVDRFGRVGPRSAVVPST